MDTLNEDILKFPPAKQILNTLVSHLGEVKTPLFQVNFRNINDCNQPIDFNRNL